MSIIDNKCINCKFSVTQLNTDQSKITRCHKEPFMKEEQGDVLIVYPIVRVEDKDGNAKGPGSCSHYEDSAEFIKTKIKS